MRFERAADEWSGRFGAGHGRATGPFGGRTAGLPQGNLLLRLDEISRLYPAVYAEFRAVRQAAVDRLLQQTLEAAQRDGVLRDDLNRTCCGPCSGRR